MAPVFIRRYGGGKETIDIETWEGIRKASQSGVLLDFMNIGDERAVHVGGGYNVDITMQFAGYKQEYNAQDGQENPENVATFISKELLAPCSLTKGYYYGDEGNTLREAIENIRNCLPDDLLSVMRVVNKPAISGYFVYSGTIYSKTNPVAADIFAPSLREIISANQVPNNASDGKVQYELFAKNIGNAKKKIAGTNNYGTYWLRSNHASGVTTSNYASAVPSAWYIYTSTSSSYVSLATAKNEYICFGVTI